MNIDKTNRSLKEIKNLIDVVSQLRCPKEGCPWDIDQTHESLIPFVIEEAYEVADAIRNESDDELKEELGDLLLQIILHAQIAQEEERFTLEDIAIVSAQKLIRRHPHVFKTKEIKTISEVKRTWESIKTKERDLKDSIHPITDTLKKKIRGQPAIAGALAISKKVSDVGFDWKDIDCIWGKIEEELLELKEAIDQKDFSHAEEELGDVIFTLINIARRLEISAEEGLASTNQRFLERFSYIESKVKGDFSNYSLNKLQKIWESAKEISQN